MAKPKKKPEKTGEERSKAAPAAATQDANWETLPGGAPPEAVEAFFAGEKPAEAPPKKQVIGTPFPKGQSANPGGLKKGQHLKALQRMYVAALHDHWQQNMSEDGTHAILAAAQPGAIIKAVSDLMPKDLNVKHDATEQFKAIWQSMATGKLPSIKTEEDDD